MLLRVTQNDVSFVGIISLLALPDLSWEIMARILTVNTKEMPYHKMSLVDAKVAYRSAYSGHWHLHHSRVVAGTPPGDALAQHGAHRDERRCAVLG